MVFFRCMEAPEKNWRTGTQNDTKENRETGTESRNWIRYLNTGDWIRQVNPKTEYRREFECKKTWSREYRSADCARKRPETLRETQRETRPETLPVGQNWLLCDQEGWAAGWIMWDSRRIMSTVKLFWPASAEHKRIVRRLFRNSKIVPKLLLITAVLSCIVLGQNLINEHVMPAGMRRLSRRAGRYSDDIRSRGWTLLMEVAPGRCLWKLLLDFHESCPWTRGSCSWTLMEVPRHCP